MCILTLSLPFPPSVNCLYAGKKVRYKSARYKAWRAKAAPHLKGAHPIEGRVDIIYELDIPDKTPYSGNEITTAHRAGKGKAS